MSVKSESTTPPPKIGKIGPYTVFITPPPTPNESPKPVQSPKIVIPGSPPPPLTRPPPVQAPPMQIPNHHSSSSPFHFFWDALSKLQSAHASLDQRTAYWFGLDQSKYQWALDHYYETNGINDKDPETKVANKV